MSEITDLIDEFTAKLKSMNLLFRVECNTESIDTVIVGKLIPETHIERIYTITFGEKLDLK